MKTIKPPIFRNKSFCKLCKIPWSQKVEHLQQKIGPFYCKCPLCQAFRKVKDLRNSGIYIRYRYRNWSPAQSINQLPRWLSVRGSHLTPWSTSASAWTWGRCPRPRLEPWSDHSSCDTRWKVVKTVEKVLLLNKL